MTATMKKIIFTGCLFLLLGNLFGQNLWTEQDRKYLLENMTRTTELLRVETAGLSESQWHFKESPDRWSIAQVIEHLGIYEMIYLREASIIVNSNPEPLLNETCRNDSFYLAWMDEKKPHIANGIGIPQGLMHGTDNWNYFINLRNQNMDFVAKINKDLRSYFTFRYDGNRWNIHQLYIILFAHCDRHLKQILKIKSNPGFPSH